LAGDAAVSRRVEPTSGQARPAGNAESTEAGSPARQAAATGRQQARRYGEPSGRGDAPGFHRRLKRRLRRWHGRIVADWNAFETLDDAGLHSLRKRIKRQRYALEFFAPVLRRRKVERYLDALTAIQDRLGGLNDLLVARARLQAPVADPAAWFALGWLAARIADVRSLAEPELGRLAKMDAPTN
jgi:hypothetical protein